LHVTSTAFSPLSVIRYDHSHGPNENYKRLNTLYDSNQPIDNIFQQIQDAQAFALACGQPYDDVMIVNFAFTLVFNTGLFLADGRYDRQE
jgi:hypothetical protein